MFSSTLYYREHVVLKDEDDLQLVEGYDASVIVSDMYMGNGCNSSLSQKTLSLSNWLTEYYTNRYYGCTRDPSLESVNVGTIEQ